MEDEYCAIANRYCTKSCRFFNLEDNSCQISNYLKANTPKKKASKTLLEGSEKKT